MYALRLVHSQIYNSLWPDLPTLYHSSVMEREKIFQSHATFTGRYVLCSWRNNYGILVNFSRNFMLVGVCAHYDDPFPDLHCTTHCDQRGPLSFSGTSNAFSESVLLNFQDHQHQHQHPHPWNTDQAPPVEQHSCRPPLVASRTGEKCFQYSIFSYASSSTL